VSLDELEGGRTSLVERHLRLPDQTDQSRPRVHLDHDRVHPGEHIVVLVDHEIRTLGDDHEIVVGDQRGDLDDDVGRVIEPRHLQVHPDEHAHPRLRPRHVL
jgi:hypothetical protein